MFKNYSNTNVKIRNKGETDYYDVKRILYGSDGKPCDFVIGKIIGADSAYGIIHETCCEDSNESNCPYVLKKVFKYDEDHFLKELNAQMRASEHGLAPKVLFAYTLKNNISEKTIKLECGFIMEKMNSIRPLLFETIEDDKLLSDFIGDGFDEDLFNTVVSTSCDNHKSLVYKNICKEFNKIYDNKVKLFKKIIQGLVNLNEIGISHEDTHLDNIMIDNNNNIMFIDFGQSETYGHKIQSENDYELLKESILNFMKMIQKKKITFDVNSTNYLKYLIIEYHLSYMEEIYEELWEPYEYNLYSEYD